MLTRFFLVIRIALIGCALPRKPETNGEHMTTAPHSDNTINPDAWYFRVADYLVFAVFVVATVAVVAVHFVTL